MKAKRETKNTKVKTCNVRFKSGDYESVQKKAAEYGLSFSDYMRQATLTGYVKTNPNGPHLNDARELIKLLIEYRTNFSRISNLIKNYDPSLNQEIEILKNSIQKVIEKFIP